MGELTAVLDLLQQTAGVDDELHVFCDSTYAINAITKWMAGWKRRGWKKGDGKPVANVEIMKALDEAMQGRRVVFEWVKGHAGHVLNEKADELANAAARAFQEGSAPDPGPGFHGDRSYHAFSVTVAPEPDPDLFSLAEEPVASDEELVVRLERALLTDEVRGDPAAVAALLHPAWEEVGRSGRRWSREEMLATIGPLEERVELEVLSVDRVGRRAAPAVARRSAAGGDATAAQLAVGARRASAGCSASTRAPPRPDARVVGKSARVVGKSSRVVSSFVRACDFVTNGPDSGTTRAE